MPKAKNKIHPPALLISAFAEGKISELLGDAEYKALRCHFDQCPLCRQEIETHQAEVGKTYDAAKLKAEFKKFLKKSKNSWAKSQR